jgi:hypothetical protein
MPKQEVAKEQTREEFWREYHSHDKNRRPYFRIPAILTGLVLGVTIIANSCSGDGDTTPPSTTTTTTLPPVETTTTTIEATTTTTTTTVPPAERFSFEIAGSMYDCEVMSDPHQVVSGDHIWKIVEEQMVPEGMPQRWIGTITLNQLRGTVGSDPNLIFPGDQIYTLVDCTMNDGLPTTE